MKYVSCDIETLGLNPNVHKIIQVGAAISDTETGSIHDSFEIIVFQENITGDPFAINMNIDIISKMYKLHKKLEEYINSMYINDYCFWLKSNKTKKITEEFVDQGFPLICRESDLGKILYTFLSCNFDITKKINFTGKNFVGFDKRFLEKISGFDMIKIHHRSIDVGSMYMLPTDTEPPSFDECLKRAGMNKKCEHTALQDAIDVCDLITRYFNKQKTLSDFAAIGQLHLPNQDISNMSINSVI